jgi:plasmid maintenance system antidote protein VapI
MIDRAAWEQDLCLWRLAQRTRIEQSRLSRCLNGRSEFTPTERKRIARVLGKSEDVLFWEPTGTDSKLPSANRVEPIECEKIEAF